MNLVRKILSQGSTSLPSPTREEAGVSSRSSVGDETTVVDSASQQASADVKRQHELSLSHLQRLFHDYQSPGHPLSDSEKEEKVYMMLPLFCKVFADLPTNYSKVSDIFPESSELARVASRLLVTEVRRRASNQSTEAAAEAIASFMEVNEDRDESSNGWMLLSALNILDKEAEIMTIASLPSTLVKCLYLFFDLLPIEEDSGSGSETHFTRKERRILLQKMLIQIMLKLCKHVGAAEELARKDDLTLLFSAITSGCPKHNIMWRKTAADILLTISRHSLSQPVISYLHNKGCVSLCIDNMQRAEDISPLETVEMFVSVFCFLKDSCQSSDTLMEDFRTCQGYIFLSEFLLKLDKVIENEPEANEAIRNLVLLVASLSFCGHNDLKMPSLSTSLHQLDTFKLPNPEKRGSTVRNIHAVQVLQNVFIKATSEQLSATILDAISTIYNADKANYFLLIDQHILSQFAEKLSKKPLKAQEKFFQILEYIVFHLKFVPCKELVSISLLLKNLENPECGCLAIQTLINVLRSESVFKDVFREVGMVEVFVGLLKKQAESSQTGNQKVRELSMASLELLLANCPENANVFRDLGGVEVVLNLIKARKQSSELDLMRQIIMTSSKEEDTTAFLELLHSTHDIDLRTAVLTTLTQCLQDSHRCRAVFRRVGGFVYVISILVSLEGCLALDPGDKWKDVKREKLHNLIKSVFYCLTVAMRYEPANARYFQVEMNCEQSIVETVKLLGCFSNENTFKSVIKKPKEELIHRTQNSLSTENVDFEAFNPQINSVAFIIKTLYDMAMDYFDKNRNSSPKIIPQGQLMENDPKNAKEKVQKVPSLNLGPILPDPIVVHPGMILAILKVMPSLFLPQEPEVTTALQISVMEVLKSVLKVEKNQQIMCDAGFVSQLLEVGACVLEDEAHVLHNSFQSIFERLAYQKLEPNDLRKFFRMGNPLSCLNGEEMENAYTNIDSNRPGNFLPLTRIKTLVAMTTPRESHYQTQEMMPPFIEFDMSPEGFGCLFLPSMAPHVSNGSNSVGVVGVTALAAQEGSVVGGIGQGYRAFPPQPGMTFSTWVNIDKFSDPRSDPHPVRLLTITRQHKIGDEESNFVCLSISLSARDRALLVSTKETPFGQAGDWQPDVSGDHVARIWFPDLIKEGEWHHVIVILNKQNQKNNTFSVYVNGQHLNTQKLNYISLIPGAAVTSNSPLQSSVQAFIGTPPPWRRRSRLCWKQGPCIMFEDVASQQVAHLLYKLGPHYLGSLQAPQNIHTGEVLNAQIHEEKLTFGLNAVAVSFMTLARIRKIYSKLDSKAIAKQLGMSTSENATPIRIIHNSAGHLLGPSRSLGGVVIGYLGVRVFSPQPVTKVIETIGGCQVLLGIVAMARDVESLYAGVKSFVCVLKSNPFARFEMDKIRGYQTLAMLLRKKKELLNSHVVHLIFTMAGTIEPGKEVSNIPNLPAFRDILCDLELWHESPDNLEKSIFEHFHDLLTDSNSSKNSIRLKIMRECKLVDKMLSALKTVDPKSTTLRTLLNVIYALLSTNPRVTDVLSFALFIASTLDTSGTDERSKNKPLDDNIVLRNHCLLLFLSLLYSGNAIHKKYCEDVVQVVGFDWVLLFLHGNLHTTTVVVGMRILTTLLSIPGLAEKFRMGTCNGHWLIKSEIVLQNKMIKALGQTSTSSTRATKKSVRTDVFSVPGYQLLNWLLPYHCEIPEVYLLLLAMSVGKTMKEMPEKIEFKIETCFEHILGVPTSSHSIPDILKEVRFSGDAIMSIMTMVRSLLNHDIAKDAGLPDWLKDYPVTLIQIVCYLYHNIPDFMPVFMTEDVTSALVGTMFPIVQLSNPSVSEPVEDSEEVDGSKEGKDDCRPEEQGPQSESLSNHPAKRHILNFMRGLIVDSLSLQATKSPPVIDLLVDAKPEDSTEAQQHIFQTEMLGLLMDHLLAADVLIGDQAALPISPRGSLQNIPPNVFYVACRIVDKLWQGILKKDPDEVFQFILKLIAQAKRGNSSWASSLEGIYRSLNRTILYLLSRPHSDVASKVTVLEVLHKITSNRSIIFGAGNHELDFFGCITYCLLQISAGLTIPVDAETKTQWHVSNDDMDDTEAANIHQGQNLLANAASRVWRELYVTKREALEEVFKTSFGFHNDTPALEAVRDQIFESSSKIWFTYVDMEKRSVHTRTPILEFHTQLESKMLKLTKDITGGLVGLRRLASVTGGASSAKNKKEELPPKVEYSKMRKKVVEQITLQHVAVVKEVVDLHQRNNAKTDEHMLKYIEEEWLQTESKLTQERGIWGPNQESSLTKWMLDLTEGPARRRQRFIRNNMFYLHYPYRGGGDGVKTLKYRKPVSLDSKKWHEQNRTLTMFEREEERIVDLEYDDCDISVRDKSLTIDEQIKKIGFQGLKQAIGKSDRNANNDDDDDDDDDDCDKSEGSPTSPTVEDDQSNPMQSEEESSDYQTVMRLLEDGENITHMYRCARIQGLDTAEGLLLFGREYFYMLDGFTLVNGREVQDISSLPANRFEPIIPVVPGQVSKVKLKRRIFKFPYDNIKEVHKRRYLLQPISIEIFFSDGQNNLLAFNKQIRSKVYQRLLSAAPRISDSAQLSVAGQKRTANVEQGSGIFSTLIGETSVTQRWVRGEISNFQYLMALNSLAGRSYNDLMQYPVFPWILADYRSDELDLTNPTTFRDLSKPMGAQTESRLSQFLRRYEEWDDPHTGTPPYHYGTHYSSAMIVSSYLVRLEPFTQHFLHLQGGHFDLADRMFHSIEEAWESASKNNMADLRELIPEFFYLPDFLTNNNKFDLGVKQNSEVLDSVILPPWAKNCTREFIRCHREALECDYVSAHLHEWIDLIFGYKQQGQAAMDAVNVFHHLFYEGNVDIFSIEDPLQRNATIGFINNFGQIPRQLFKKPHPSKRVSKTVNSGPDGVSGTNSQVFFHHLTNLRPSRNPIKELKGPVGQIQNVDRVIYAVEENKILVPGNANRYLAWGFADQSFRLGNYESDKPVFVCEPNYQIGQVLTCVCPNSKVVLTAGTSTVVSVYEYHKKVKQLMLKTVLYGHNDAVTCLVASPEWNIAVSGSRDRTGIIWDLSRYSYVKQLPNHIGPVAAVTINELTGDIVTSSGSWIYLWDINGRLQTSVNTSPGPLPSKIPNQILCICCSQFNDWDRENVIMTGSTDGVVRMFSIDYIEVAEKEVKSQQPLVRQSNAEQEFNSFSKIAKKMSMSMTAGNCIGNLREVIAQTEVGRDSPHPSDNEEEAGGDNVEGNVPVESNQPDLDQEQKERRISEQTADQANVSYQSEDFVMISENDLSKISEDKPGEGDGYVWLRRLIFRAKLTMHTAFERSDNNEPAAVTALAVSKDHKTIYVGDDRGRVFSWTVSSKPGKGMVDHWCKDEGSESCLGCGVKFTIYERRHHCRSCGKLFCSSCSQYQAVIPKLKIHSNVRVCKPCYDQLKSEEQK